MDAACYHSVGVDTAMLYNGTTLNKALLLDWPVTLCVHSLDLLQSYNFSTRISQETRDSVFEVVIPRLSLLRLILCSMFGRGRCVHLLIQECYRT